MNVISSPINETRTPNFLVPEDCYQVGCANFFCSNYFLSWLALHNHNENFLLMIYSVSECMLWSFRNTIMLRVKSTLNTGCCTLILFCYLQHNYWIKSPFKLLIRWFQASKPTDMLLYLQNLKIIAENWRNSISLKFKQNKEYRKFCFASNCFFWAQFLNWWISSVKKILLPRAKL